MALTVHVRYREEVYDMLLLWVSSQSVSRHARSSLATTELASVSTRFGRSNDGNMKQKTVYYTPWNGSFSIRYHGHLLVFRREFRPREFNSREEVSVSCFSRSPRILRNCSLSAVSSIQSWSRVNISLSAPRWYLGKVHNVGYKTYPDSYSQWEWEKGAAERYQGLPRPNSLTMVFQPRYSLMKGLSAASPPWDWKIEFELVYRLIFWFGHLYPQPFCHHWRPPEGSVRQASKSLRHSRGSYWRR
jgi:hypothetical protein